MVVGQDMITNTLKNAIVNKHLAQAYLFCGPRGVGKTTCARIFAKTINCGNLSSDSEACDQCESCKSFNSSRSFNIHELDAASNNKVEDIRSLNDQVRIPPQIGQYSIYIIDEVHMLSASAFNAFLKTLEEPPSHAIFILATTEKHKIIPTILSRCQIFDFKRIRVEDIINRLKYVAEKESVKFEDEALHIIAQKADGAMRDALSIFDQLVSLCGKSISYQNAIENLNVLDYEYYFKVTNAILNSDISSVLLTVNEIIEKGFDGYNFLLGLNNHFRDLLVSKDKSTLKLLETTPAVRHRYAEQAALLPINLLFRVLDIGSDYDISYKNSKSPRLHIELALIKMCSAFSDISTEKKNPDVTVIQQQEAENSIVDKQINKPKPEQTGKTEKIFASVKSPLMEVGKIKEPQRSLSIKDAINATDNTNNAKIEGQSFKPEDTSGQSIELKPIDEAAFMSLWTDFIERFSNDGPRFSSMMKTVMPQYDENKKSIFFEFSNSDQKELFVNNYKQKLLAMISQRRGGNDIELVIEVESTGKKEIIYSDTQKLQFFQSQYPNIKEFIKEFHLTT
jgi:DNA polymerase-3 subunit gamma/tau